MAGKQKTHAKLKKELDKVFSQYIRYYYADHKGYVECYTCGVQKPVKQMQAGHFQSRKHMSTRWHENNVRPQCVKCNMYSQGEQYLFGLNLDKEYGDGTAQDLVYMSNQSARFTNDYLLEKIKHYEKLVKKLL